MRADRKRRTTRLEAATELVRVPSCRRAGALDHLAGQGAEVRGGEAHVIPAQQLQAFDHPAGAQADHVLVCNDARMQETYWCAYRRAVDAGTGLALPEPICAEAVPCMMDSKFWRTCE